MECAVCMDSLSTPAESRAGSVNFATTLSNLSNNSRLQVPFILSNNSRDLSITQCGHLFHTRCLQNWITSELGNTNCPNCREKINVSKIIQLTSDIPDDEIEVIDIDGDGDDDDSPEDLPDNLPELRAQYETLVTDYYLLKSNYLANKEELITKTAEIQKTQRESDAMKEEITELKKNNETSAKHASASTEPRTRGHKRRYAESRKK